MGNILHSYPLMRVLLDGMLSMMVLYGLLAYWQQRKAIYWQYALYIACMMITFYLDDQDYKRADYAPGGNYAVVVTETFAFLLYIRFAILLMNIEENDPLSYRLLRWMTWLLLFHLVLDTVLVINDISVSTRSQMYTLNRYVLAAGALAVVPRIIRLRQQVVIYFIVGSFFFVAGCLLALSVNFIPALFVRQETTPFSFPVTYMELGVVAEVLCFTLGIARLNQQNELEKIGVQAQLIDQLRENEQKQLKLSRIRDEIARDLHDDVGSDLSAISLLSKSAIKQVYQQPEQVAEVLQTISQTSKKVLGSLRDIVWSLNSAPLTYENLTFRMHEMGYSLFEKTSTTVHFEFVNILPESPIPTEQRRDVFLLFKEILHNVFRHAKAQNVWVQLIIEDEVLILTVKDDGAGFDSKLSRSGNGLHFMKQRADALGGNIHVNASTGQGTLVVLTCPVGVSV